MSMYCAQDLCQQCLCTVFRTMPTMCTVFRTKPTMFMYCVQDLCHRLCTVYRPFANNVYVLCSGPTPTMSVHRVQDLCQQCLCTVFRTYAGSACRARPRRSPSHCTRPRASAACPSRQSAVPPVAPPPPPGQSPLFSLFLVIVCSFVTQSITLPSVLIVTVYSFYPDLSPCVPSVPFVLVSHRSFLSSLSSSVPLCPRSIALTSVLIVTVCSFYSHCLFLLS